jgi:hypothetical protein
MRIFDSLVAVRVGLCAAIVVLAVFFLGLCGCELVSPENPADPTPIVEGGKAIVTELKEIFEDPDKLQDATTPWGWITAAISAVAAGGVATARQYVKNKRAKDAADTAESK